MRARKHKESRGKGSRRARKNIINGLIVFMSATILLLAAFLLFQTHVIKVSGTQYSYEGDVLKWINSDSFAVNSLYIFLRYNNRTANLPPAIEQVRVRLNSPWQVELQVSEKPMYGYIYYFDQRLYFDRYGISSLISHEVIPDVILVEGLDIHIEEVELGMTLAVEDESVFQSIREVITLLKEQGLSPDRLVVEEGNISLYFGGITVLLGSRSFSERLIQVSPIFEKLEAQHPGVTGVLHLERFELSDGTIRFVPDVPLGGGEEDEEVEVEEFEVW